MECGNYSRDKTGAGDVSLWRTITPAYLQLHLLHLIACLHRQYRRRDLPLGDTHSKMTMFQEEKKRDSIISNKNHRSYTKSGKLYTMHTRLMSVWAIFVAIDWQINALQTEHCVLSNIGVTNNFKAPLINICIVTLNHIILCSKTGRWWIHRKLLPNFAAFGVRLPACFGVQLIQHQ